MKEKSNETPGQKREQVTAKTEKAKTIVFYGNSLTAGYGVDPSESFPSIVQDKIDSLQLPYKVINAALAAKPPPAVKAVLTGYYVNP